MPVIYECSHCKRSNRKLTLGNFGICHRTVNGKWMDLCNACLVSLDTVLQDAENVKREMLL